MRRLRVLSEHPHLGRPNDLVEEFEGAQAYVDAGLAEWAVTRSVPVETTAGTGAPETAVVRPSARRVRGSGRGSVRDGV